MKVVIDTNCLIASIPRQNPEYWLYDAFRAEKFDWVISNEILHEYEEQLSHFYSPTTADLVLKILTTASNVIFAEPYFDGISFPMILMTTNLPTWPFLPTLTIW